MSSPSSDPTRARRPAQRHLLTVLHSGERTGPPILALRFLRWLAHDRPDWQMSTLFLEPGPMVEEFAALGSVVVHTGRAAAASTPGRLARTVREAATRRRLAALGPVDLVHVHCAGAMWALDLTPAAPVLCHLHELDVGLDLHLRSRAAGRVGTADAYVAVSDGVVAAFLQRWPVGAGSIHRRWGFVDLPGPLVDDARSGRGLEPGEVVVVGSGVRHWRKGPELFVRSAQRAIQLRPDLRWRFVWVGGTRSRSAPDVVDLVEAAGASRAVQFVEHQSDAMEWIAAADLFVSSAREDAFPLVCVEAAALGTPIVTFDNGGAADLVRMAGCGEVVPFPQIDRMAATLVDWACDADRRAAAGAAGRRFAELHLSTAAAGPDLLAVVEATMGPS